MPIWDWMKRRPERQDGERGERIALLAIEQLERALVERRIP